MVVHPGYYSSRWGIHLRKKYNFPWKVKSCSTLTKQKKKYKYGWFSSRILTDIFRNWCQSLLWFDYKLSYSEADSFPLFTKNALTTGKMRYLWCTCDIARIQASIWVTEVTGSTQNIVLLFQFSMEEGHFNCMKQFDNIYYKVSFYKFKIQTQKIRRTSNKHSSIYCIVLSTDTYLLTQRCCGIRWCWHMEDFRLYSLTFTWKKQ